LKLLMGSLVPTGVKTVLLLSQVVGAFKDAPGRDDAAEHGSVRADDYYDDHPISESQVLAAVARRRGPGTAPPRPDDLFDFDQDHYGGVAAVAALARRARVGPNSRVLDLCAGLGGPARFLAWSTGCRVTALERHAGRAASALRLTRLVGLSRGVTVVRADALAVPFRTAWFDACLSQEALLHVPDKVSVLRECHRVLAPGGRLAFTDWIAHPRLGDRERQRLQAWMAATTLQTLASYRGLLGRAGFGAIEAEDISDEWRPVLRRRHDAYRGLRADGAGRHDEYRQLHAFFVGLVEDGKLGGGRFTATR
jgi:SAM-dependent methyltransferase